MQENVLFKNPALKKIFTEAAFLYDAPLTISQISFDKKTLVEDHILMAGDAAGMITPLCGNGMSMAMHASKLAFNSIDIFLQGKISREEMEKKYSVEWKKEFSGRLTTGRIVQRLMGHGISTNLFLRFTASSSFLSRAIIHSTHGKSF